MQALILSPLVAVCGIEFANSTNAIGAVASGKEGRPCRPPRFLPFLPEQQAETETMSEPQTDEKIDATFRNGSLTATGIILGFSLNFISLWVSNPNDWSRVDLLPMAFLTVGIAFQVKVFADLLARDSLLAVKYDRARRLFLIGLSIVAIGMGIALLNDILGLSSMRMFG
ncbi:hypothetical protein GGE46_000152 [Rhizobium etli]|uniref:Transmemrbane protein n=2 Tax=Rhizobium etli TaxID=29449 RepID=A0A7W6ZCD4_RHIET|nr:hypothetical protein [Rhizobium etli]MBB4533443.1 hypothetical protein [Rhizobium etli]